MTGPKGRIGGACAKSELLAENNAPKINVDIGFVMARVD